MAARVEQAAVVMLAVDLDQAVGDVAKQRGGNARPAGEGAAAAVGLERPADQQRLARLGLDALLGQQREGGMVRREARIRRRRWPAARPAAPVRCRRERRAPGPGCRAGSTCPPRFRRSARQAPARTPARAGRSAPHRGSTAASASAAAASGLSLSAGQRPPTARAAGSAHSCAGTICCPGSWRRARPPPYAPPRAGRGSNRSRPAAPAPRACGWWSDICRPPSRKRVDAASQLPCRW